MGQDIHGAGKPEGKQAEGQASRTTVATRRNRFLDPASSPNPGLIQADHRTGPAQRDPLSACPSARPEPPQAPGKPRDGQETAPRGGTVAKLHQPPPIFSVPPRFCCNIRPQAGKEGIPNSDSPELGAFYKTRETK